MYKEKQNDLFEKINTIITNTDYRLLKETVGIELRKRNLDSAIIILASEIIMKNAKVEQLVENDDIKLLFFFTDALNKALIDNKGASIILENYFWKSEIEELIDYKLETINESIFPITITEVTYINDHHYTGVISGEYMHILNSAKVPIYNPNTQRNPRNTKHGDKITTFPKKIFAISEDLQKEIYEPDEIIWNILKNGDEKFVYNPKSRTLTIYEGSAINIVDGQNRKEANSDAMSKKPELNHKWILSILNVSEIKAHDIMVQKNKQTKMPEEWIGSKDRNKVENRVISIMQDERSNLFEIMKETDKHILNQQGLVKKSNIAEAIKEQYSDILLDANGEHDNEEIRNVGRWLSEFFDYMIKLYSYEFKEKPYEVKKTSFINWKNMFFGYVSLSKVLQGEDNWKELFKEKMQSLDFNNTNPLWQNLGMLNTKDANSALRKNLYNLFKEDVK